MKLASCSEIGTRAGKRISKPRFSGEFQLKIKSGSSVFKSRDHARGYEFRTRQAANPLGEAFKLPTNHPYPHHDDNVTVGAVSFHLTWAYDIILWPPLVLRCMR